MSKSPAGAEEKRVWTRDAILEQARWTTYTDIRVLWTAGLDDRQVADLTREELVELIREHKKKQNEFFKAVKVVLEADDAKVQTLREENDQLQASNKALQGNVDEVRKTNQTLRDENDGLLQTNQSMQMALAEQAASHKTSMEALKTKTLVLTKELVSARERIGALEKTADEADRDRAIVQAELDVARQQIKELENSAAEAKRERAEARELLEETKKMEKNLLLLKAVTRRRGYNFPYTPTQAQLEQKQRLDDMENAEIKSLRDQLAQLARRNDEAIAQRAEDIKGCETKAERLAKDLTETKNQLDESNRLTRAAQNETTACKTALDACKSSVPALTAEQTARIDAADALRAQFGKALGAWLESSPAKTPSAALDAKVLDAKVPEPVALAEALTGTLDSSLAVARALAEAWAADKPAPNALSSLLGFFRSPAAPDRAVKVATKLLDLLAAVVRQTDGLANEALATQRLRAETAAAEAKLQEIKQVLAQKAAELKDLDAKLEPVQAKLARADSFQKAVDNLRADLQKEEKNAQARFDAEVKHHAGMLVTAVTYTDVAKRESDRERAHRFVVAEHVAILRSLARPLALAADVAARLSSEFKGDRTTDVLFKPVRDLQTQIESAVASILDRLSKDAFKVRYSPANSETADRLYSDAYALGQALPLLAQPALLLAKSVVASALGEEMLASQKAQDATKKTLNLANALRQELTPVPAPAQVASNVLNYKPPPATQSTTTNKQGSGVPATSNRSAQKNKKLPTSKTATPKNVTNLPATSSSRVSEEKKPLQKNAPDNQSTTGPSAQAKWNLLPGNTVSGNPAKRKKAQKGGSVGWAARWRVRAERVTA